MMMIMMKTVIHFRSARHLWQDKCEGGRAIYKKFYDILWTNWRVRQSRCLHKTRYQILIKYLHLLFFSSPALFSAAEWWHVAYDS